MSQEDEPSGKKPDPDRKESPEPKPAPESGPGITPGTPSFSVIGPTGEPVQFYSLAEKDPEDEPLDLDEEDLFEPQ